MAVPGVLDDDVPTQPAKRPRCDATASKPDAPAAPAGSSTPATNGLSGAANSAGLGGASDTSPTGCGEIKPPVVADRTSQSRADPPPYAGGGYVAAGDGWWAHSNGEWLYNVAEKTYFHLPSGELRLALDEGTVPLNLATISETQNPDAGAGEPSPATLSGQVKWFNRMKGFGFLEPLHNGSDSAEVFFHKNQLVGEDIDLRCIRPGVQLSYSLGETDDGRTCAVQVKVAGSHSNERGTNGKHAEAAAEDAKDEAKNAAEDEGEDEVEDEDPEEGEPSSSESSVDIDLFEELHSGMYQVKGETKDECEDFAVDKVKLPISVLGETATCVFFGVFDGHGGGYCAEYAAAHLAKNVLARLRDRTKTASDESALRTALLGGFRQTEHNFLQHARRVGDCSGTTACTMTVFGPDEEMRLRLFLANAGDSRAVLGKASGGFLRLTEDHKPNLPAEKKRVEAEGGSVVEVGGVWRTILPQKRRTSGIVGLAVSRSLGDKDFKAPNIVSPDPDITIHEIDWDDDEFVILASDGIWDVVSEKVAVRLVQRSLHQFGNEEKAAEELVCKARDRGSKDDCTVLIVRFGWLKAKLKEGVDAENASEPEEKDDLETKAPEERAIEATQKKGVHEEVKDDGAQEAEDEEEGEEEEEEEDDDEVEASEGEEGGRDDSTGALPRATGDDDSDDDIFAAVPEGKEDGGDQGERMPEIATPAADTSDLFAGLGPTREELLVVEGPALPLPRQAAVGPVVGDGTEEAPLSGTPAVDGDMDMFGA